MRTLIFLLAWSLTLPFGAVASAQGLNKCRDAAGKVTYASQECELLGLKPAGEIQNRSSVAPAYKPPPKPVAKPADKADPKSAASKDKVEPDKAREPGDRRCFKTAKGTRCNDEPEPDPKKG